MAAGIVTFAGTWKYQSFLPKADSIKTPPTDPLFVSPVFIPWSPPGTLTVNPDGATGTLVFAGLPPLNLEINVGMGPTPTLFIKAKGVIGGRDFTNELQGWFSPSDLLHPVGAGNPLVVRGSIIQTSEDIAPPPKKQPAGTVGYFILQP